MIGLINSRYSKRIITLEDPVDTTSRTRNA